MKVPARSYRSEFRAALAVASLIALAGCHGEHRSGHDDIHIGHVIPAHKPKSFPDAVRRLRELNPQIGRNLDKGQPGSPTDEKTLNIATDIANWLPEIAADSDMPEPPWNEVNIRSATIVADYQAIRSVSVNGDARSRVEDAARAISDLETLLASADPHWFAGAGEGPRGTLIRARRRRRKMK